MADLLHLMGLVAQADIAAATAAEAESLIIAGERAVAAIRARQAAATDVLAAQVDAQLQDRTRTRAAARAAAAEVAWERGEEVRLPAAVPVPDLYGFVGSMLAPALRTTSRVVARRVEADQRMLATAGTTFRALWHGDLDQGRADAVTEALQHLDAELWETFEALVYETTCDPVTGEITLISDSVKALNRGELRRRARRVARHLDPGSERRAANAATDRRRVVVREDRHEPGMAVWTAHLPSAVSQQMAAAVDALAAQVAKANPRLSMDAARADALAALVQGNADVTTTVELLVPVLPGTLSGGAPGAAFGMTSLAPTVGESPEAVAWFLPGVVEIPRHGVLLPEAVAALLASPDTVIRLARLDPDGSIVQDPTAYRPSASTKRRVRSRDGVCRFPGCATPAARSDTDHVLAHPKGPTDHTNLIALCRTHHLFKHHSGWEPVLAPNGVVTWTAPDGRTWTTRPRPHQFRDELHLFDDLDDDSRHDLVRGWLPGLPPGMSLADLVRAERAAPTDPPEPLAIPAAPDDWSALDVGANQVEPEPPAEDDDLPPTDDLRPTDDLPPDDDVGPGDDKGAQVAIGLHRDRWGRGSRCPVHVAHDSQLERYLEDLLTA